jgi:hypothetical protein
VKFGRNNGNSSNGSKGGAAKENCVTCHGLKFCQTCRGFKQERGIICGPCNGTGKCGTCNGSGEK